MTRLDRRDFFALTGFYNAKQNILKFIFVPYSMCVLARDKNLWAKKLLHLSKSPTLKARKQITRHQGRPSIENGREKTREISGLHGTAAIAMYVNIISNPNL